MTAQRAVDYKSPPVVETAFALVFAPIKNWNLLHFGLLWNRYRSEYPNPEVKLPTGNIEAGDLLTSIGPDFDLRGIPLRCWFVDKTKHQLLQVQRNFFIRNWRKIEDTHSYVHYDEIRPSFVKDWKIFKSFLADENLDAPQVFHTEVTYVNHLVKGQDWENSSDIQRIFPYWGRDLSGQFQIELSSFMTGASLPGKGRLEVKLEPALRSTDGKQILQLTITVIQVPTSSSDADLFAALDSGHDVLVKHFAEIISIDTQKRWEPLHASDSRTGQSS